MFNTEQLLNMTDNIGNYEYANAIYDKQKNNRYMRMRYDLYGYLIPLDDIDNMIVKHKLDKNIVVRYLIQMNEFNSFCKQIREEFGNLSTCEIKDDIFTFIDYIPRIDDTLHMIIRYYVKCNEKWICGDKKNGIICLRLGNEIFIGVKDNSETISIDEIKILNFIHKHNLQKVIKNKKRKHVMTHFNKVIKAVC